MLLRSIGAAGRATDGVGAAAGSWGTALAIQFGRSGHDTRLWGRDAEAVAAMSAGRANERYLPGITFPPQLSVTADLAEAVANADDIVVSVPSHSFRDVLTAVAACDFHADGLCWATKGFETETGLLPHQVVAEVHAKLRAITGVSRVQTRLVWDPPRNLDRMSEAARLELGFL